MYPDTIEDNLSDLSRWVSWAPAERRRPRHRGDFIAVALIILLLYRRRFSGKPIGCEGIFARRSARPPRVTSHNADAAAAAVAAVVVVAGGGVSIGRSSVPLARSTRKSPGGA